MEIWLVVWIGIGLGIAFWLGFQYGGRETVTLNERTRLLEEERAREEERREKEKQEMQSSLRREEERADNAERELTALGRDHHHLKERLENQRAELEELQAQMQERFENLANRILEKNTEKFTEQHQEKLSHLLKPFSEKMEAFRKQVEEAQREELKGRGALEQHLKMLQSMNENMTEEARNLTRALKGDTKKQGNWGEVILERILERSGLKKGREYEVQPSFTDEEGKRKMPDVVVHLPDEKFLVIDSKVSLVNYERGVNAEEEEVREKEFQRHVVSMRTHIKGLSAKRYDEIYPDRSPDFILLFVPIEPAFAAALQVDSELYNDAFDQHIIVVSPTTLLATLATIENVWKQEYQNQNVAEIARRGGLLYDKFVNFAESMIQIGDRLEKTREAYDSSMGQLNQGSGNLIRQVEMLKELGAKASKVMPEKFQETLRLEENGEEPEAKSPDDGEEVSSAG
ncbi:MAG: DNA recombination protein RmuC [Balneolaceae bacterium]